MRDEACRFCRKEVVWWAILVNIAQMTYKGLLGLMTGSAALIADSMHSGADVVASLVTMTSIRISSRERSDDYPYGYGNIQYISSSIVGLILIIGAMYLIYQATARIFYGELVAPSGVAVLGATVSVITNELMYRYQSCVGRENNSPAIIANAWDNRSDAMSSLAVLVGVLSAVIGFPMADSLAAAGVGLLVARIGVELNVDAVKGLMDSSIDMEGLKEIYDIAKGAPDVKGVRYLRGRSVGENLNIDVNLYVDSGLTIDQSDGVADLVQKSIFATIDHVSDVFISFTPVQAKN